MKVKFLVEMKVEEIIDISFEEFTKVENMTDEEKENFFWDKALHYESKTTKLEYYKVIEIGDINE